MPGRGLWASGAAATRALTHAAAQEWRADGIHVALLVVDATIDSPKTEERLRGRPRGRRAPGRRTSPARSPRWPPRAPRGYTHELVITPAGDRWVP